MGVGRAAVEEDEEEELGEDGGDHGSLGWSIVESRGQFVSLLLMDRQPDWGPSVVVLLHEERGVFMESWPRFDLLPTESFIAVCLRLYMSVPP